MTARRCDRCGHGEHVLPCLNMASDNDCTCRGIMDDPDTVAMRDAINSYFGTDPNHWMIACAATKRARKMLDKVHQLVVSPDFRIAGGLVKVSSLKEAME